ncbi:cysteine desulfurase family protein [Roseivirga sp. BDSF3-8]|uniref:cysteine desulfurase family protein n=1 Tax=Roseivirga sp. BDSF3-8 TaxID=3241598 RepID=UPI0035318F43
MSLTGKIYLDHNATTPVDQRVVEAMLPYFCEVYGNPSSISHAYGWDAEEAVSMAREQVAGLIGAKPGEVYFTSGATESINLALQGICLRKKPSHLITCRTEHRAVLDTCQALEEHGAKVTYLDVDRSGRIDLQQIWEAIRPETVMVCLMHANNETGVIHPLREVADLIKNKGILLMTDATQSVGKIPFKVGDLGVDLAAFSAHKLYGPKGVGGLFVSQALRPEIRPLQFGGGQEKGLRPGTLNVPGIVGLGKACEICGEEMAREGERLKKLVDLLEDELSQTVKVSINGQDCRRLPHMTNLSFENIDGSRLIRSLKRLGVSQGSACTSATIHASHVLKAMGHTDELALSSLRIGLGRQTTEEEVKVACTDIKESIQKLTLTAI